MGFEVPWSLYSARHLKALLAKKIPDDSFRNAHLIVTTTNYVTGDPAIHYLSDSFDNCLEIDNVRNLDDRKLLNFSKIEDIEGLRRSLLASASIPLAFPPVKIKDGSWHVDGGLANNTPVRQIALYLRHMSDMDPNIEVGNVYCVIQNTPETLIARKHKFNTHDQLARAYDLLHFAQMLPVIDAWEQINANIKRNESRVAVFLQALDEADLDDGMRNQLKSLFLEQFQFIKSSTKQLKMELLKIQPGTPLSDLLDFTPSAVHSMFDHGFRDTVQMLRDRLFLSEQEKVTMLNKIGN
jgi:predicted acylesterase/phospholipase RssA